MTYNFDNLIFAKMTYTYPTTDSSSNTKKLA